jgi:hypothetical protein
MVVVTLIEMMNMMFGVGIVVGVQEQQIVEVAEFEKVVAVKVGGIVDIEEKLGVIFVDTLAVEMGAFVVNFEMDIVGVVVAVVEQMIVD